ncbi:uncharacterized protein LOC122307309 isoform X2 [Carya illinoinensis]|uniref:uncharacterized protein LOC122307309 isoform X2 n=1 Tax=Carya illinoinensis TaxID=32201 RepID=UPI001C7225E2|nr:uncharacterized protein LOC122307309 isoform X2 [Carya illinoinensis]
MERVGGASSVRIDRKSSIDSEPRTLSIDQIHYAREAALYVMKTMSIEEAMSNFTQVKSWSMQLEIITIHLDAGILHLHLSSFYFYFYYYITYYANFLSSSS